MRYMTTHRHKSCIWLVVDTNELRQKSDIPFEIKLHVKYDIQQDRVRLFN